MYYISQRNVSFPWIKLIFKRDRKDQIPLRSLLRIFADTVGECWWMFLIDMIYRACCILYVNWQVLGSIRVLFDFEIFSEWLISSRWCRSVHCKSSAATHVSAFDTWTVRTKAALEKILETNGIFCSPFVTNVVFKRSITEFLKTFRIKLGIWLIYAD